MLIQSDVNNDDDDDDDATRVVITYRSNTTPISRRPRANSLRWQTIRKLCGLKPIPKSSGCYLLLIIYYLFLLIKFFSIVVVIVFHVVIDLIYELYSFTELIFRVETLLRLYFN